MPKQSLVSKLNDIQSNLVLPPRPWKLDAIAITKAGCRQAGTHSRQVKTDGKSLTSRQGDKVDNEGGAVVIAAEAAATMLDAKAYLQECKAAVEPLTIATSN